MTNMNISLPEALKEFVETEVRKGGYSTPSEYVRELLREAQKRKAEEKLLLAGLRTGKPSRMTSKDWERIRRRIFSPGEAQEKKRRRT